MAARLSEVAAGAEAAAAQEDAPDDAWRAIANEWQSLRSQVVDLPEDVAQRFAAAEAQMQARDEARRAAVERELKQQLQRLDQLMERAVKRAAAEDLTLREKALLIPLVAATIILGVYPKPVFDVTTPAVAKLVADTKAAVALHHAGNATAMNKGAAP